MPQTTNKPVKSFRLRGVSVSVFANPAQVEDKEVVFHKVVVQRTYKEADTFKTTSSLGRDDLPVATMLMTRAWEWILDAESRAKKGDEQ